MIVHVILLFFLLFLCFFALFCGRKFVHWILASLFVVCNFLISHTIFLFISSPFVPSLTTPFILSLFVLYTPFFTQCSSHTPISLSPCLCRCCPGAVPVLAVPCSFLAVFFIFLAHSTYVCFSCVCSCPCPVSPSPISPPLPFPSRMFSPFHHSHA